MVHTMYKSQASEGTVLDTNRRQILVLGRYMRYSTLVCRKAEGSESERDCMQCHAIAFYWIASTYIFFIFALLWKAFQIFPVQLGQIANLKVTQLWFWVLQLLSTYFIALVDIIPNQSTVETFKYRIVMKGDLDRVIQ